MDKKRAEEDGCPNKKNHGTKLSSPLSTEAVPAQVIGRQRNAKPGNGLGERGCSHLLESKDRQVKGAMKLQHKLAEIGLKNFGWEASTILERYDLEGILRQLRARRSGREGEQSQGSGEREAQKEWLQETLEGKSSAELEASGGGDGDEAGNDQMYSGSHEERQGSAKRVAETESGSSNTNAIQTTLE